LVITIERDAREHCVALYADRPHNTRRYKYVSVLHKHLKEIIDHGKRENLAPVQIVRFADGYRGIRIRPGLPYPSAQAPDKTLMYQLPLSDFETMASLFLPQQPKKAGAIALPWYMQ
jgi:hypothetical protein